MLNSLERKFGRFAIPGLLKIIAAFQALVFLIILIRGDAVEGFLEKLYIVGNEGNPLKSGQYWRFFTFLLIPAGDFIAVIFTVLSAFFISDGLERAWGVFRVNLYFFANWLLLCVAVSLGGIAVPSILFLNMFLAFAVNYPHFQILLYGVVPLRVFWLAIIDIAYLVWMISAMPPLRLACILTLIQFLVVFGPGFLRGRLRRAEAASRLKVFKENSVQEKEEFHRCKVCGRTDAQHPELEFRIASDGGEYCKEHLP